MRLKNVLCRTIIYFWLIAASSFADDPATVASPDGRFALFMGAYKTNHFDTTTSQWVTDSEEKAAAIIDAKSHKVLVQLQGPLRSDEDRALWSADSKWFAFNHRGNKETDLSVYFWDGQSFQRATLPELPEPALKERPNKKPPNEQIEHFDFDKVTPLRWLKPGVLIVARDYGMTNNTFRSISYSRSYIITISFDATHIGHVKNVTKQEQKVEEGNG
jgi:hypothetical protein